MEGYLDYLSHWGGGIPESVITDSLLRYGVSTEAEATDLNRLYAIGKVEVWKQALRTKNIDPDALEVIQMNLANAEKDLNADTIQVFSKANTQNPYKSDFL